AANYTVIRDSARCAAEPDCHFDVDKRRCYEGPRPNEDACVVPPAELLLVGFRVLLFLQQNLRSTEAGKDATPIFHLRTLDTFDCRIRLIVARVRNPDCCRRSYGSAVAH